MEATHPSASFPLIGDNTKTAMNDQSFNLQDLHDEILVFSDSTTPFATLSDQSSVAGGGISKDRGLGILLVP
jgi:hypothetical protein